MVPVKLLLFKHIIASYKTFRVWQLWDLNIRWACEISLHCANSGTYFNHSRHLNRSCYETQQGVGVGGVVKQGQRFPSTVSVLSSTLQILSSEPLKQKFILFHSFFRITRSPLWSLWVTAPPLLLSPHFSLYDSLYEQEECRCPACWSHFWVISLLGATYLAALRIPARPQTTSQTTIFVHTEFVPTLSITVSKLGKYPE